MSHGAHFFRVEGQGENMTTFTRSSALIEANIRTWPLASHGGMAGEAAATTLLSAGLEGILGHASPEEWERIQSVLRSMSGFVQDDVVEDALTVGPLDPWSQTQHFVRYPGCGAADSICVGIDAVWSDADEAVFLFRCGDTLGATSSLGRALQGLQGSFSPAHVRRVKDEDGVWVIKDVLEDAAQDGRAKDDEKEKTGEAARSSSWELGQAAVLASQLLLSYFVQRVLGLASEASQIRETLESTYLRAEVP
jgi:hypothetical protein